MWNKNLGRNVWLLPLPTPVFLSCQSGGLKQWLRVWLLLFFPFKWLIVFLQHIIFLFGIQWSQLWWSLELKLSSKQPEAGRWSAEPGSRLYVSFYCLLLEALGAVAIKYLWYFGKHHSKMEVKNIYSASKRFPFNLQVFIKGKKNLIFFFLTVGSGILTFSSEIIFWETQTKIYRFCFK